LRSRAKAEERYGVRVKAIVIQEAGLDGFWIHRLLLVNGIESQVVDAASIAVDRRHRRAKTDSIDGETLLRTLMAWARGERRVCSMVRAPSPEEEDRRRLTRERGTLVKERIQHTNRIVCSAAKASGITARFGEIVLNGSRRCEPATAVSCRRS
jgi:transposase